MKNTIRFADLPLSSLLKKNVAREGYDVPTPVQAMAIPPIVEGRDVLASAPTGTGKTAAFTLPLLHRLAQTAGGKRHPRALVLCPTRELAGQITDALDVYGHGTGLRHAVVFGGVGQGRQVSQLRRGVDFLIATPGRLMDLMAQGHVDLRFVETLVLDEADRMLDMGFIPAVRKIAGELPKDRQTLLFSATIPPTIKKLVAELMHEPFRVEVAQKEATVDTVEQKVLFVKKSDKPDLLAHLVKRHGIDCGIVFSRTKHGADRVVKQLGQRGIRASAIHGNRNQNQRQRALDGFRRGKVPILVATDVAARGIDVDGITHVINYDLTHEPETYVHRIGRTGRAGATGISLSFCDADERAHLRDIQKLLGREIEVDSDHPYTDGRQSERTTKPRGPSGRAPGAKPTSVKKPKPKAKAPKRPKHPLASSKPKKPAKPKGHRGRRRSA
ncbi:MAG: DEAD/DEAH box helicase [Planctomycetota bacterium]